MADALSDERFLLGVLNSTPVIDGVATDDFADPDRGRAWLAGAGGLGTETELRHVLEPGVLAPVLQGAALSPAITDGCISWTLTVSPERELAVRAVLSWDALAKESPGRLRPCANDECRLFLIDHSKAGTARWCSMAVCGNRMKARRHYRRARGTQASSVRGTQPA